MNGREFISVFTPSQTDPEHLESIFVQREDLLADAVERVRESALTPHKHHLLFAGPRGCGKTHLVTLIVHRLGQDESLEDKLRIAWLNEDETCTTVLELLIKCLEALTKRYPNQFSLDVIEPAYELEASDARELVAHQLLEAIGKATLLIVVENLDAIFGGLGDAGQKELRALIQENPRFAIVATAQRLVEDLTRRTSPFFGFFQTEHLRPLGIDDAAELLRNIARLNGQPDVAEFLRTTRGRSRIRALHHLSGGNHRIYLVLSQFITRDSIDALVGPFVKMVDELTPYYQERVRWLPTQQRKIIEYLCGAENTVPVKELAKRLFATPQTISSQLQDLREKGYVVASQRGRESLYEISEPLMRICVEVKENQRYEPLKLLVDFLRVWYEDDQLADRLAKLDANSNERAYLESAVSRNAEEGNLRKQMLIEDLRSGLAEKMAPQSVEELLEQFSEAPENVALAFQCLLDGEMEEALTLLTETIKTETDVDRKLTALEIRAGIHGQLGENEREIADYTAVIDLDGAPVEPVAKALNNRGVTHGQLGENEREIADYTAVIDLDGAPVEQVAQALYNRGFTHGQLGENEREIADYTAVIDLDGAPVEQVARALYNRGFTHGQLGENEREIADYTAVIDLDGAPVEQVARALYNRGVTHGQLGENEREIADYTAVIDLDGAPVEPVAKALNNRGVRHGRLGENERAIADYTAVIDLDGAPVEQVARALNNRGVTHGQLGENEREIADYTAVIDLDGAPVEQVARALNNRGVRHGRLGENERAIADHTAVIDLDGAPVEQVAEALYNRGVTHGRLGENEQAIADYTAVIDLDGAPVEQVAQALYNRGVTHGQLGENEREIADHTAVIDLGGAPVEQVAQALNNRGVRHGQLGENERAIADYTAVIDLAGAPVEQVAQALYNRGVCFFKSGDESRSAADFEKFIRTEGAPSDKITDAHLALAEIHMNQGSWETGFEEVGNALRFGSKSDPAYRGSADDLVGILFEFGLSPGTRIQHINRMVEIFHTHRASAALGEGLIEHLGQLFQSDDPLPATDNLEQWAVAWEKAAKSLEDMALPIRIFRCGIDFLKSGGKDEGILLDLVAAEREILRQALGLSNEAE